MKGFYASISQTVIVECVPDDKRFCHIRRCRCSGTHTDNRGVYNRSIVYYRQGQVEKFDNQQADRCRETSA
jgi:hypothetical protein